MVSAVPLHRLEIDLFQSPAIPNDGWFCVPIEVTSGADVVSLNAMQTALEAFGLQEPFNKIVCFIYKNPTFAAPLSSKIYLVLIPVKYFAIYQTWM
jgi:hypothetical protein